MLYIQDYPIIQCFCSYHCVLQKSVRKGLQINTMSLLGGSIPFGKWSITLVNESSKERVIPFPTGLFLAFFMGVILATEPSPGMTHPSNPTNSYTPINLT